MELIKKEKLLFGLPIEIKDMGVIYQPKLRDFIDKDFDIQKFIRAFSIKAELILENAENIKDFDVFIYQLSLNLPKENLLITDLIDSLKLLYRTDKVDLIMLKPNDINSVCVLIEVNDNKYYINRDNYEDFANIVLITLDINKNIADKKLKEELSEIELKMEKKRKEFEKRRAKEEAKLREQKGEEEKSITLYDLANYIIHTDNSQFNYQSVLDLTIYQLKNTFNLYKQKENYKIFMDYKTSGQFKMDDDISHWFFKN